MRGLDVKNAERVITVCFTFANLGSSKSVGKPSHITPMSFTVSTTSWLGPAKPFNLSASKSLWNNFNCLVQGLRWFECVGFVIPTEGVNTLSNLPVSFLLCKRIHCQWQTLMIPKTLLRCTKRFHYTKHLNQAAACLMRAWILIMIITACLHDVIKCVSLSVKLMEKH